MRLFFTTETQRRGRLEELNRKARKGERKGRKENVNLPAPFPV